MREKYAIRIKEAIAAALPPGKTALHQPVFAGNECNYVKECIDTGWVSSVGGFVDRFEQDLAAFTGAKKAVSVASGTAALHICLIIAGVKPGDEVIAPALTFIATINAITYCGATPHFADSAYDTLGLDARKLRAHLLKIAKTDGGFCYNRQTNRRIGAVLPMHTFGHPADLDALEKVCGEFNIPLIEDAAESIGSYYKGRHTGTRGVVAALSFNGNKTVTTGGGGAVITNDEELGRLAKHLTTQAKVAHRWEFKHDMIGYNYRMPNINAALGCAQIEQLPGFLEKKRRLSRKYKKIFQATPGVAFVDEPAFCKSNFWLNAILLDDEFKDERDSVLAATNDAGIMTRPAWDLMHTLPMFMACPRMDLGAAQNIAQRLINIPSSADLIP